MLGQRAGNDEEHREQPDGDVGAELHPPLDQQAQEQKYLDKALADYNAAQNFPQQSLTNYAQLLSQFGGFGSSGTTATYGGGQSNLGLGIGAGLLGLGAYNALK